MRSALRALALLALAAVPVPGTASAQAANFPPFLELRVPKPPSIAYGEPGAFLTYELHITSFMGQPVVLKSVEVHAGSASGPVLQTVADTALQRRLLRPGVTLNVVDRQNLGGGLRAIVYLWVPVDASSAPATLVHRVTITQGTGDSVKTLTLDGPAVPVSRDVVSIGPPLKGGPWFAANGPSNASGHRRTIIPIDGTPAIGQRFAIDFVKLGDDGSTFTGDRLKNENYHAEGVDALAVADGKVVEIKDGLPENVPGANSRAVPIDLETVGGNHVVLDIGGGHYAFYAHLRPGSIPVKLGDRVKRGQVVGHVGNTGNSTEPHLHFHISDGISPLGAEGIPYQIDSFEVVGHCVDFGEKCDKGAPVKRTKEQVMGNSVVRFP